MSKKTHKAWLKSLAGLTVNISAAWFGLAFLTPNFTNLLNAGATVVLFRDITFGIIFLLLTVFLERSIK